MAEIKNIFKRTKTWLRKWQKGKDYKSEAKIMFHKTAKHGKEGPYSREKLFATALSLTRKSSAKGKIYQCILEMSTRFCEVSTI